MGVDVNNIVENATKYLYSCETNTGKSFVGMEIKDEAS